MSSRATALALATLVIAGACKDSTIPKTPTHLIVVSGSNQAGNVSAPLDSALVVQAQDGGKRPVGGVALTWTAVGGGTLSSTSTTTDNDGKSSVRWTLSPTAGTQVVTVTSTQIPGASVSFLANNGAAITGNVSPALTNPFSPTFMRGASQALGSLARAPLTKLRRPIRIIIGLNADAVGIAAAASGDSRSLSVARDAQSRMRSRLSALMERHHLRNAEISPVVAAARMTLEDPARIDAVMQALRSDPTVAWVEPDAVITIRDGAPRPVRADLLPRNDGLGGDARPSAVATRLPNDGLYWVQTWSANMLDLPKAWAITTGSANVTVASVDMGTRFDHPSMRVNATSDGYDFVSNAPFGAPEELCDGGTFADGAGDGDGPDADPTDPEDLLFDSFSGCWFPNDLGAHGLWTAGIIGALGNQSVGMAGVNWNVRIRPIRVLDVTGSGFVFDIAQGILYAAGLPAAGADGQMVQTTRAPVINVSIGGGRSTIMGNAVAAANNAGSLIVASAGNDGLGDIFQTYPAAFPGVVAVAAVGMDGALAGYSSAGSHVSVAAPGGDFRDDNLGGGVLGPGWDYVSDRSTYLLGFGTSAAAPFVSGIAALLLAQEPSLTPSQLRTRIEQFATRPAGSSRSDLFGWGIVNAYNSLTQQKGSPAQAIVRLIEANSGAVARTTKTNSDGSFAFTKLANGAYYVQAGDDESGDGIIGLPGRRLGWAGGNGKPTTFTVNGNVQAAAVLLGIPAESEPNDDAANANVLSVGSYVSATITTPDSRDVFTVAIPAAGTYVFETSGVLGTCGFGLELDTFIGVTNAAGTVVGTNDNFSSATSRYCSRLQTSLQPGTYTVTVTASPNARFIGNAWHGRYRLEVRLNP
jgi:serine protease